MLDVQGGAGGDDGGKMKLRWADAISVVLLVVFCAALVFLAWPVENGIMCEWMGMGR